MCVKTAPSPPPYTAENFTGHPTAPFSLLTSFLLFLRQWWQYQKPQCEEDSCSNVYIFCFSITCFLCFRSQFIIVQIHRTKAVILCLLLATSWTATKIGNWYPRKRSCWSYWGGNEEEAVGKACMLYWCHRALKVSLVKGVIVNDINDSQMTCIWQGNTSFSF